VEEVGCVLATSQPNEHFVSLHADEFHLVDLTIPLAVVGLVDACSVNASRAGDADLGLSEATFRTPCKIY
jgi:hypothetical protein